MEEAPCRFPWSTIWAISMLSDEDANRILGVMLSEIQSLGMTEAQRLAAAAGINVAAEYWLPFRAAVDAAFRRMTPEERMIGLRILGDGLSDNERVKTLLAHHGFEYVESTFVPTAILDQREARYLPKSSASELAKAMKRLIDGDESGAITSACGAVDALMQDLYTRPALSSIESPGHFSFSARVNTAAAHLAIFEETATELLALGMNADDVKSVVVDMRKATNHAAQMLQTLRRSMGDVHGSKPALRRTAYDCIKWASAICALFEGQ